MNEVVRHAVTLYESGHHEELWDLADHLWDEAGSSLTTDIAEVSYLARTAYVRAGREGFAGLWGARAMVASVLSGSKQTGARLLLPEFFRLQALGFAAEARQVLGEMPRLVDVGSPGQGSEFTSFARLYFEKTATSFLLEGDYAEAAAHYRLALERSEDDPRGQLKVRGGLALATYLSASADDASEELRTTLVQIRDEADRLGFPDVVADAVHDLRWLAGAEDNWRPFELL